MIYNGYGIFNDESMLHVFAEQVAGFMVKGTCPTRLSQNEKQAVTINKTGGREQKIKFCHKYPRR